MLPSIASRQFSANLQPAASHLNEKQSCRELRELHENNRVKENGRKQPERENGKTQLRIDDPLSRFRVRVFSFRLSIRLLFSRNSRNSWQSPFGCPANLGLRLAAKTLIYHRQ
jgi:hypothetical protein